MKDPKERYLTLSTGGVTALGLIAYFMLMNLAGLVEVVELRILNFLILGAGIGFVLWHFNDEYREDLTYLKGMTLGLWTTFSAVALFTVFLYIYLRVDTLFMEHIRQHVMFGDYLTPVAVAGAIFFEGVSSGAIFTLMGMQYFKRPFADSRRLNNQH